ncbi:C-factor, partial [Opisthocomus hoazin]
SKMGELRVCSVLVTGANRGIGLGLVQHLLGLPNPPKWVFAACRDPEGQRAQVRPGWDAAGCAGDGGTGQHVGEEKGVGEQLGGSGLNLLINNAAMLICNTLDTETLESMTQVYTTNTIGPMLLSQAFLPLLKKAAQGSPGSALPGSERICNKPAIVNMSSSGGSIKDVYLFDRAPVLSYRCSKAALNMLTKCQSLGYREHGVLCVALHPGWVQTDMGGSGSQKPPLTVDDSVRGMLKVLCSLSEKDTGTFLDWEGNVVPW